MDHKFGRVGSSASPVLLVSQGRIQRGGLWGCNPPKALETHREQCAGIQIYSTVRAQSTVQPEREKKAGVLYSVLVCGAADPHGATPSQ